MTAVALREVAFRYGRAPEVLTSVSLEIEPGQVVGLLGANGAGKTTLLRLLAGLATPSRGSVEVAGFALPRDRARASLRIGFAPDQPLAYPRLSALENLFRFAWLWKVPPVEVRRRAERLLREAQLWDDRHRWVEQLSRGMQQRVGLCCALLHEPEVLILDEPFDGLDIESALWLRGLLRRLADGGRTVLLSSHRAEALDSACDRLAVLRDGRLAQVLDRKEVAVRGGATGVYLEHCRPPGNRRAGEGIHG